MLPKNAVAPPDRPWPALMLVIVGLVALAVGALGGELAATAAYGTGL